ncbi:DegT/DnrJ/EryC1/StrS family aminotransferase [Qipengyuania qiaonensis]|uniref:DegT/DnrJ/EryC1/StrS family aminotransferase n=1 Tax=Qipengyuania qiaonensis TaxID=2867240 RepID=A0ABS7J7U1_9SPHN|nr:DegT/DnrJ/EryC1/StrS family aminotransferase [Qipengyuania qiaonensis]MBX7483380.1 DegT/DnrJ/EryC1/StrS family aminotransferase [Qipengyuania qiaonensis]
MTVNAMPIAAVPQQVRSSWPLFEADEREAVMKVLTTGKVNALVHGDECNGFADEFAEFIGANQAICMANGTVTLEIALRALGVGPGDEVIVPARSFFATASCVAAVGALPVFADVLSPSQNIDPASVERMITSRTKAVICVHLAGWPCDMAALCDISERHGLFLIEDCAQAHGAAIDGRKVGTFGDAASFSFCTDKIMSTGGEGGLLIMRDEAAHQRAWSLKDHGKNPTKIADGKGAPGQFRYIHDSLGSNGRMTEMQAAIGRVQLRKLPDWLTARRANAEFLSEALTGHPLLIVPEVHAAITHAWYKFYLLLRPDAADTEARRAAMIGQLVAKGIPCGTGSCPDMSLELGLQGLGCRRDGTLANAHMLGHQTLMLLVDHTLDQQDMALVAEALWELAT